MNPRGRSSSGLWTFSHGDFATGFVSIFRGILEDERAGAGFGLGRGGYQAWRYVRPRGRGLAEVRAPGCGVEPVVVPVATGSRTYSPGQVVSVGVTRAGAAVIGEPPSGLVGASLFSADEIVGDVAQPRVTAVAETPHPGVTGFELTLTGENFETGLEVVAEVWGGWLLDDLGLTGYGYDWERDPWVTLSNFAYVSATQATCDCDVDAASPYPRGVQVWIGPAGAYGS